MIINPTGQVPPVTGGLLALRGEGHAFLGAEGLGLGELGARQQQVALTSFNALFERNGTINGEIEGKHYINQFERMGGINVLESLLFDSNKEIYKMAYSITETYFSEIDENVMSKDKN